MPRHARLAVPLLAVALLASSYARADRAPSFTPYQHIEQHYWPTWSPDGRQLAFVKETGPRSQAGSLKIHIVSSAGGPSRLLLDEPASDTQPAWSPDGRRIAFVSERSGERQIWTVDPNGRNLAQLTHPPGRNESPAWSPDGKRIAFTAVDTDTVYIVAATGGEPVSFAKGHRAAWSQDGALIAYQVAPVPDAAAATFVKAVAGGAARQIKSCSPGMPALYLLPVSWMRDNRHLACTVVQDAIARVLIVEVTKDAVESAFDVDGVPAGLQFSPDGTHVAFSWASVGHPAHIRVSGLDGRDARDLTETRSPLRVEAIEIPSVGGLRISAYLVQPRATTSQAPAIVWLHGGVGRTGFQGFRIGFDAAVQYFADNGWVVLVPDYQKTDAGGAAGTFRADIQVANVVAAAGYLRQRPGVDPRRVSLIGFSYGGLMTLNVLGQQPDAFASAVEFSGPADLASLYEAPVKGAGLTELMVAALGGGPAERHQANAAASPITLAGRFKTPVLMFHGRRDTSVPVAQSEEMDAALVKANKPHALVLYDDEGHVFMRHTGEAFERAMDWLMTNGQTAR